MIPQDFAKMSDHDLAEYIRYCARNIEHLTRLQRTLWEQEVEFWVLKQGARDEEINRLAKSLGITKEASNG